MRAGRRTSTDQADQAAVALTLWLDWYDDDVEDDQSSPMLSIHGLPCEGWNKDHMCNVVPADICNDTCDVLAAFTQRY
jgi:hypothetical protein